MCHYADNYLPGKKIEKLLCGEIDKSEIASILNYLFIEIEQNTHEQMTPTNPEYNHTGTGVTKNTIKLNYQSILDESCSTLGKSDNTNAGNTIKDVL